MAKGEENNFAMDTIIINYFQKKINKTTTY